LFFEGRINWLQGLLSVPVIILVGVLIAIVLTLLVQVAIELRRIELRTLRLRSFLQYHRFKSLIYFCSGWILVYLIFLAFWYPYFTPYRLFYLPPILCLIAVVLLQSIEARRKTLALLVAGMALSNFLFFIYPMVHSKNYPPLEFALKLNNAWQPGSLVFYSRSDADNQLVRYFNPATQWEALKTTDAIESYLENAYQDGKSAWLETSAIDQVRATTEGKNWLVSHTREQCSQRLVNNSFRIEFVQLFPKTTGNRNPGCTL
jgi:hypothetical protein